MTPVPLFPDDGSSPAGRAGTRCRPTGRTPGSSSPSPPPTGGCVDVATLFLTNRECPFRCLMCDLWKNTLEVGRSGSDPRTDPLGAGSSSRRRNT